VTSQPILQLLPAVDVRRRASRPTPAGGDRERLVSSATRIEAALAWQEQGAAVAAPSGPRPGLRSPAATPTSSPSIVGTPRHQGRDEWWDPRRREPHPGAWPRAVVGSTWAPRPSSTRSGRHEPSPSTATGSPSASMCGARPWPRVAGRSEGGDLWETLERLDRRGLCPLCHHGRRTRTACSRAPTSTSFVTCAPAPTVPVVASGGVSTHRRHRRSCASWSVPVSRERLSGRRSTSGAFTLPEALGIAGRP
jgi:hypothetical protein